MNWDAIALDLEGTLISNAISQFPRPGLAEFLEFCHTAFPRVVLYTDVRREVCERIQDLLVREGIAPTWFKELDCVDWDRRVKDLRNIPGSHPETCLILDDNPDYILPEQKAQWIPIETFRSPYPETDSELARVRIVIEKMLAEKPNPRDSQ